MALTLSAAIRMADDIKPNAFSDETKTAWLNECEGMVQTQVLLLASEEIITYSYSGNKDTELLVKPPHDKIYWSYLCAMIDFANGEYDKYTNSMQMFNAFFGEFMRWFAKMYRPADTHGATYEDDTFWKGYYITAYGLAVKHGYKGTETDWVRDVLSHAVRNDNPHGVTSGQVGAYDRHETDELLDGVCEKIATEGITRQQADEQLSKAIEEESTARSEADAKLKKDLQSELAGKSPTDHTHTTLPTALALTDGKTSTAAYGFAFDNTVTGFANITISGTTSVTDFGQSFAPKNRTASSRWINISVPSALMPRHASMPYTLRLTLSMAAQSGITPLEIMGLYKGGSGDVRVTPISDAWTLSPGETKSFVFNLDTGSTSIKSAGFSIDLKAANAECFDAMRFTVESFTVLPSAKVKTDRKPAFVRFGERYIVPADAPDVNRAVNQFWYADGAVQSFMVDDVGVINAMVADPKLEAASMLVESHNHIIDNENPHGVTAEQTGAYDKTQTDELLANKSTVGHIHPLANVGVNTNLAGIEIQCRGYDGASEPTVVLSYRDETTTGEKYVFPNNQYYSDFSIFGAGDRVSLLFEGNCEITVNGKSEYHSGTYTLPETLLTAPIDVMTEFGNEVGVTILYADQPRDGFMSATDKETLQGVQASLGDIDTALDAILAMQETVIGGETA